VNKGSGSNYSNPQDSTLFSMHGWWSEANISSGLPLLTI